MRENIKPIANTNPVTLNWMPEFIGMVSNLPSAYVDLPRQPPCLTPLASQIAGIQAERYGGLHWHNDSFSHSAVQNGPRGNRTNYVQNNSANETRGAARRSSSCKCRRPRR